MILLFCLFIYIVMVAKELFIKSPLYVESSLFFIPIYVIRIKKPFECIIYY